MLLTAKIIFFCVHRATIYNFIVCYILQKPNPQRQTTMEKTNKKAPTELGTEKISKLLTQYAIPAIIAQTAASLYNMIDSVFIGQGVGALAISGLATTFPFMNLSAAFGAMVGLGGATQLSVRLGQRDYDSAKLILGNIVTLNIIVGALFAGFSLLFLDEILYFFGASDATLPYARDYMQVILYGNIITHLYFGINAALRAAGHPRQAMVATIITVVGNIILTPLFIYVFDWGITGAALATILAQTVTLLWQMRILGNPNELLHLQRGIYTLKKHIVKAILSIGMSPFFINAAACLVVIIVNKGLRGYGENGDMSIAAYGIANRVTFIFVMIVLGLTQGMQPIVGYNYGAKQYKRVGEVFKLTCICATIVMVIGFILNEFFPAEVARAFTPDSTLITCASKAMRIMSVMMPLIGFQMVTTNFFQSIGMVKQSIVLSLTRQILFLIPLLLVLPLFYGEDGVWYSAPISDLMAAMLTIAMLRNQFGTWKKQGSI